MNRPVSEIGKERTKNVAKYIIENNCSCQLMLSSNATRAQQTAQIIAPALNCKNLIIESSLYLTNLTAYFNILFEQEDSIDKIAIVGHNPGITEFANYFLTEKIWSMPTSAVLCIDIAADKWIDITMATHKKRFFVTPKTL